MEVHSTERGVIETVAFPDRQMTGRQTTHAVTSNCLRTALYVLWGTTAV